MHSNNIVMMKKKMNFNLNGPNEVFFKQNNKTFRCVLIINTTQCKNKNKQNDLYLLLKKLKLTYH